MVTATAIPVSPGLIAVRDSARISALATEFARTEFASAIIRSPESLVPNANASLDVETMATALMDNASAKTVMPVSPAKFHLV
jgi:hypothetical protein